MLIEDRPGGGVDTPGGSGSSIPGGHSSKKNKYSKSNFLKFDKFTFNRK